MILTRENIAERDVIGCFGEIYKILYIGNNYIITLRYSTSHYIADPEVSNIDSFLDLINEQEFDYNNEYDKYIFENLTYNGFTLKSE